MFPINSSPVNNPASISCLVVGEESKLLVIALFQIQVTMPRVSARRQHDPQYTALIFSLPVVPAGPLPSALLCQRRTFSALKMQTRQAGPDGNTRGGKYHQRRETVIVVLESVAKTKFCTFRLRESLFTFIEVTKPDS